MATNTGSTDNPLSSLTRQYTVLLTSHRRDGTGVGTPVNVAVEGDHAYFRTWHTAWKVKRMRNNPEVEIAPSTLRGAPTGPEIKARVRLLDQGSKESKHAAKLLARKHPLVHGVIVPLSHKIKRVTTLHYELRPLTKDGEAGTGSEQADG